MVLPARPNAHISYRSSGYWATLLRWLRIQYVTVPVAQTFLGARSDCASHPVQVGCSDGLVYMIKGCQIGRAAINEQIVGRLGRALGAPVATVSFVRVPRELVEIEPAMGHIKPGLAHGSIWIDRCTDREWYTPTDAEANNSRHACLAVLNGWLVANDAQVIYYTEEPRLVFSVDHGNFFPGGPDWTIKSLGAAKPPKPDAMLLEACSLPGGYVRSVGPILAAVSDFAIAGAIASVPEECDISLEESVALAEFVASRRDYLVRELRSNS